MGRLAKSLLVIVDCSQLTVAAREDLFMNSRDRLSNGELRKAIEEELEDTWAFLYHLRFYKHPTGIKYFFYFLKDYGIPIKLSNPKVGLSSIKQTW